MLFVIIICQSREKRAFTQRIRIAQPGLSRRPFIAGAKNIFIKKATIYPRLSSYRLRD